MKAGAYARFSTDKQSSTEDQLRVCRRVADRNGFKVVATFEDAAISGGTAHRPGYQAMLAAARRRDIDVIVAEDASRLWRNMAEQAPRLAELRDLGIDVVTQDLDTRQESSEWVGPILGTAAQAYRKEIARRTRRGLEGRALKKMPTGGKAYGYATVDGRRVVIPEQAAIIQEIFGRYAAGESPLAIVIELNRRNIPSPGAAWNRTTRRRGGWVMSAVAGDRKRAVGILNCEAYRGRIIWNRCRWVRSAADSKQRRAVVNDESQWVVHEDESLRIVPEPLWRAVKARQDEQYRRIGQRVSQGMARNSAKSVGRQGRYILSGLLKCSECGSNYTIANPRVYVCSAYINGRVCSNGRYVRRDVVESRLLADIREQLLRPAVIDEIERRVRRDMKAVQRPDSKREIAKLRQEVDRIVDAIAQGLLSPALRDRLRRAEAEIEKLEREPKPAEFEMLLPKLPALIRQKVAEIGTLAEHSPARARDAIKTALQAETVLIKPSGDHLVAEYTLEPVRLATGSSVGFYGSGGRI